MSSRLWWALIPAVLISLWLLSRSHAPEAPPLSPGWQAIVAILGSDGRFEEPYGVARASDGTLYIADGVRGNRIYAIAPSGAVSLVAGSDAGFVDGIASKARFRTPSALAVDASGVIYVADTGNNAVRRITRDGHVSTIARDLNGPIGAAVDRNGRVVVSDTYNDRIVIIDDRGEVTPLAIDVPLDTPTGLALDAAGTLYIADTGNNVIRAIATSGAVTTIDALEIGGIERPLGVAVGADGALYVTEESGRILELASSATRTGARVVAGGATGFRNGFGMEAQFRRPAGIVAVEPGRLVVADAGNGLVRSVTATSLAQAAPPPSPFIAPRFDPQAFAQTPLLWPLEPLYGPFEIAGTIGEARGQDAGRFHAGIDVRAEQGAPVLAVRDGIVTAPLSTGDFGSLNEWLRVGELTYVHVRVGRDLRGNVVDTSRFVASYDERGRIERIRVKRGAQFETGDTVGSVNPFNHVHLNVGWGGEEYNPLLFRLVQFEDKVPPTIARGGIRLFDAQGTPLVTRVKGRVVISGPVQVVVDAWDQADGNRPNRRLGVYSLGYQVLRADGTPAPGYEKARETIRFDRLVTDPNATRLVYAPGSGIPYYGQRRTRFLYIVTNTFRDGIATHGVWDTAQLPPGDYTLRVKAADISGNEAQQHNEIPVVVTLPAVAPGS